MPLIEPLETKELRRVEDFVIVIDTSMSCSGELVRQFLEETYSVLTQSETYFKKVNIHIIQCDDRVLEHIKKDVKAADIIAAGQKLKRCGLQTSVTLISGLGGRKGIRDHAIKSAELITGMNPEYASFLTLRLYEGTEMNEEVKRGDMELITPDEIVEEMELFLKNVDSPGTVFRTNHASNYVVLAGNLNEDIPRMLGELEEAKEEQRYRLEEWRRHI